MTKLSIPEMHCEHCVARIQKALEDAGLSFTVSLEDKSVTIDGAQDCVKKAVEELDDLGFSAVID